MAVEIADWNDLNAVRNDLQADYELVNDLDKDTAGYNTNASATANGGNGWKPIANDGSQPGTPEGGEVFQGTFNGQGHEIADLVIDRPNTDVQSPLGRNGGTIKKVGFVDVDITGHNRVAGLVSLNDGGASILKSYVTGNITAANGELVGGFVGDNLGNIEDSYVLCDTVAGTERVGGFVAFEAGDTSDQGINRCYSAVKTVNPVDGVAAAFCETLGRTFSKLPNDGFIYDSYVDIERSNQSDAINRRRVDQDDVTKKQTNQMQGDSPTTEMGEFDFSATWETVKGSDTDATDDGYPILQAVDRDAQLQQQGIFNGPLEPPSNLTATVQ